MKTKLKPCPFCGSKAKLTHFKWTDVIYSVNCTNCEIELESLDEAELIKRWNTRHDEMTIKKTLLLIVDIAVYSCALACLLAIAYQICLFLKP